ncbi:MAG: phospholipid methyltransferase [Alphaproteobacteria bacterium CG_4_9_14_3_um_filter_47_13]|nr:MAG: phospholipid methyltransferase [Alphaproteobacteria bacterium CG_4_9_14_3_um_filter_47_13]
MNDKNWLVRVGDFFFKWRNFVFPVILVTLFLSFSPPAEYAGARWVEDIKDIMALCLVLAGLGFRVATIGWAYIKRGGLNKQVYADKLVTEGYFKLCRNPLYVGNMLIYSGIFIFHGHPFVVVAGIGLYWFIYETIIAAEEYFLKNKFGVDYDAYCAAVPRWKPDFSSYKEAVKGMSYSVTRAVAKDYTTIFNAILAIFAIELIEHYLHYSRENFVLTAQISAVCLSFMLAAVIIIKKMKKAGKLSA